jgi:phage recombination protein Bet
VEKALSDKRLEQLSADFGKACGHVQFRGRWEPPQVVAEALGEKMTEIVHDNGRNIGSALAISPDQIELVRKTIAQGATDDELRLFLYDCQRRGVHPLDRLVHFTKRGGKYTPVTGIDFMRTRAHASGACAGISDAEFEGDPGSPDFQATVTVKRIVQGIICDFTGTARWSEYFPGDQGGFMWKKMPHTMLGKCAEALTLRKGFPEQLAGLYAREEMDQATTTEIEPLRITTKRGTLKEVEPTAAARARFFDAMRDLGLIAHPVEWIKERCQNYLQRDLGSILEVKPDEWDHATEMLRAEYTLPGRET